MIISEEKKSKAQFAMRYTKYTRLCIPLFMALFLTTLSLWRTDFFSREKIEVPLLTQLDPPARKDFEWPRTFHYLGRGRQCFAFASSDGRYVLKFFDRTQLKLPWQRFLPSAYRAKEMKRFADRVRIYPESYRIALEKMPDETGLLAVHQGASIVKYPTVEVVDKAARRFFIDLNRVPFVLQKRGKGKLLSRLSMAHSSQELESMIEQFLSFHSKRIGLFIADGDRDVKRNYAWIEDCLLYIDPARFAFEENMKEPSRFNREWWAATYRLRRWISVNAPDKLEYFDRRVEECKGSNGKSYSDH